MKKIFLSILLAAATSVAFGQGQGELTTTTTTTTTTGEVQTTLPKPRPPSAAPIVPTEGAVQVAIRTGNPNPVDQSGRARALRECAGACLARPERSRQTKGHRALCLELLRRPLSIRLID